jgi:CRISPR system Cascade subunit CasC
MNFDKLFLDIHAIQTVPPSNINRDDTGSPKTAQYGGVRRSRVSSQSWKRAIRKYFNDQSATSNVGIRSLDIVNYLAEKILEFDENIDKDEAIKLANETLNSAGVKTKDNRAKALFFLGENQANALAQAAVDGITDKKELQQKLSDNPALDIALFGRMVADDPSLNEDASAQVAHAISTHAVQTEFDFYTALDDLSKEDNAGAGMLGTTEFNSSTLYRYANVAVHEFEKQVGNKEALISSLKLFVKAFSNSMPTGKINTFANQTLPSALVVSVRSDRPINLVSAFEKPVKANGNGFTEESIEQLKKEYVKVHAFVDSPEFTLTIGVDEIGELQENLNVLLENMGKELDQLLMNE